MHTCYDKYYFFNIRLFVNYRNHIVFFLVVLVFFITLISSNDLRSFIIQYTRIDNVGHFIGFFCLTWLLHGVLNLPLKNILFCLIFYGALSEFGQHYLGFRNGEFNDFIADVFGVLLFALFKWAQVLILRLKFKHEGVL